MSKAERIEEYLETLTESSEGGYPACYSGYFVCFNRGDYYEAHDVLEHLWLTERESDFYKGLIQLAGAFVHMRKNYEHPQHPKHANRLAPASRLLLLARNNLGTTPPKPCGIDLKEVEALITDFHSKLEKGGFESNPWSPGRLPRIELQQWQPN